MSTIVQGFNNISRCYSGPVILAKHSGQCSAAHLPSTKGCAPRNNSSSVILAKHQHSLQWPTPGGGCQQLASNSLLELEAQRAQLHTSLCPRAVLREQERSRSAVYATEFDYLWPSWPQLQLVDALQNTTRVHDDSKAPWLVASPLCHSRLQSAQHHVWMPAGSN